MNDPNTGAAKRPTLLTVICILSFIMGAIGLWTGYRSAFTDGPQKDLDKARAQSQEMLDQLGDSNPMMTEMMENSIRMQENMLEHAKPIGYSGLVMNLIGLVGIWLMWKLKKNGFWLYLLSTIGGTATGFMFMEGGFFANLVIGFAVLISIIFVILYAVNLKHMR